MSINQKLVNVHELIPLFGDTSQGVLVLMIGLPASGKSTVALLLWQERFRRLSSDSVRLELYGDDAVQGDDLVYSTVRTRLDQALELKQQIVLNMTNHTAVLRQSWLKQARDKGCTNVHLVFVDTPLETCLERNRKRRRVVPETVLRDMHAAMVADGLPQKSEGKLHILRPAEVFGQYCLVSDIP